MKEARGTSIRRTVELIKLLIQGKELTNAAAAKHLGSAVAGVRRQLDVIASLPCAIVRQTEKGRAISFDMSRFGPVPTIPVAVAACFGASLWRLFAGTQYEQGMQDALQYLLHASSSQKKFAHFDRKFFFVKRGGEVSLPASANKLDLVLSALLDERRLRLKYSDFDGKLHTINISPLSVAVYEHQLYLVGSVSGQGIRLLRFARIVEVAFDGNRRFQYPSKRRYDPDQLFEFSFGVFFRDEWPVADVRIRLAARWAHYVQTHKWHPHQTSSIASDGSVLVAMRVRVCPELRTFILGFGDEAQVVAPKTLRLEIRRRIRRMQTLYRRKYRRGVA